MKRSLDFGESAGYLECVTSCQFVSSFFRSLGSVDLVFVSEEDLEKGEEIEIVLAAFLFFTIISVRFLA